MRRSIAWALGLALVAAAGAAATGGTAAARADEAVTKVGKRVVVQHAEAQADEPAERQLERDARRIERRIVRRMHDGGLGADAGYLGVTLAEVDREAVTRLALSEEKGALVARVHEDTPAAKAGLKKDDVIVKFQGEPVRSAVQFSRLVRETPPGRTVALDVLRGGRPQAVQVEIGRRELAHFDVRVPEIHAELLGPGELGELSELGELGELGKDLDLGDAPDVRILRRPGGRDRFMLRSLLPDFAPPRRLGLRYQEIGGQLADYFQLAHDSGVLVAEVDADGPAAKAGVQAGDVILSVGDKEVRDGSDLREALAGTEPGEEVSLKISRKGQPLELNVTLGGRERERRGGGTT